MLDELVQTEPSFLSLTLTLCSSTCSPSSVTFTSPSPQAVATLISLLQQLRGLGQAPGHLLKGLLKGELETEESPYMVRAVQKWMKSEDEIIEHKPIKTVPLDLGDTDMSQAEKHTDYILENSIDLVTVEEDKKGCNAVTEVQTIITDNLIREDPALNNTKNTSGRSIAGHERDLIISDIFESECDMLANQVVEIETVSYDQLEVETDDADKDIPSIDLELEECAFEVEEVLAMREVEGSVEYLVKWLGYNREEDNTWEPQQNLRCEEKVLQFQTKLKVENCINEDLPKLAAMKEKYDTRQFGPMSTSKWFGNKINSDQAICKICSNDLLSVPWSYKHNRCHQVSSLDVCPCTICDEWFSSIQELDEHVSFHDQSKDPAYLYCNVCAFSCKAKVLNKGQTGPYNFRAFGNKMMKEHRQSHEETHQCHKCDKSYNGKKALQGHLLTVHSDKIFQCEHCEFTNHSKFATDLHVKRRHTEERDKKYNFNCPKCEKKFLDNGQLRTHMRNIHQETEPVNCLECNKVFRTAKRLSFHAKSMHGNLRKCKCNECGKMFNKEYELMIHHRVHTGERPFKCDVCKATFNKLNHKGRHMKIHTGVRPHICSLCGKGFVQKTNMVLHQAKCV